MSTHNSTGIAALLAALAMTGATAFGITIDTVTVGHAGNAADSTGYGAVSYEYQIGTTEVTNAQYAAFLNAVAATDTYGLYNTLMGSTTYGGITRSGTSGSYTYTVKAGYDLKPVTYVSFYDACRFTNWLTNGQKTGAQDATTTESGLYVLDDKETLRLLPDHATSIGWVIPNENEWYKAAYYNPTLNGGAGGYTNYPWAGGASPSHTQNAVNGANYYGGSGTVENVGSYVNATSYFGTYDQAGNVWEWNDAIYSDNGRVLRGGSLSNDGLSLSAASGRLNNGPASEAYFIGFRVASLTAVPEPSTWASAMGLTMLVFGVMVRRGRRTL
ncbi:hypothetical protein OpiT1DRAFT_00487 [Opitutaceae bacterium TAV1]|nr:hypothetical protein OpiT1DRAFT_00487 [Opitutaceae bacterium TAV1]